MEIKDTLSKIDAMLAKPRTVKMTKAAFDEYVEAEIVKAKAEQDDEKDQEKAKKRLTHLKGLLDVVAKAEGTYPPEAWSGDNGEALIPVFELGVEDTTRKGEVTEKDNAIPMPGNASNTMADGQTAFASGGPSYNQPTVPMTNGGVQVPASGVGTQGPGTAFVGSSPSYDQKTIGKSIGELNQIIKSMQPAAPVAKAAPPKGPPAFEWPGDLADKDFVKDGIAKRDLEWGNDSKAPPAK